MSIQKEIYKNDLLLKFFFDLGDGINATKPQIQEHFQDDNKLEERLRYLHSRSLIKNVAPYTLRIDKPGIILYCEGGFKGEWHEGWPKRNWIKIAAITYIMGVLTTLLTSTIQSKLQAQTTEATTKKSLSVSDTPQHR